jgi:glutamine synthetase
MIYILFAVCIIHNQPIHSHTHDAIVKKLKEENISYVMLSFCNILGELKELTVPLHEAIKAFEDGLTFDGSSVKGYRSIDSSDLLIKPDMNTCRIIPWMKAPYKTAWFLCDVFNNDGKPLNDDPRRILKNTLSSAYDMGYTFYVGPELEFFFIKNDQNKENHHKKLNYFNPAEDTQGFTEKLEIITHLQDLGIPIEKIHREVAEGQYEVSMAYGDALEKADDIIRVKHALRVLAPRYNMHAVFMPKPYSDKSGSGMHMHYSLYDYKHGKNVFYDASQPDSLSHIAQQFIAGNLKHVYELSSLFNGTINSYKRLVPFHEAPTYIAFGFKNRSTLIRIPAISAHIDKAMRAEIRCPDPLCNPYLACTGLLSSGLKGIKESYSLEKPVDINLYHAQEKDLDAHHITRLPSSLEESIKALKESSYAQELLGTHTHSAYVTLKEQEIREYNTNITNWEYNRYID